MLSIQPAYEVACERPALLKEGVRVPRLIIRSSGDTFTASRSQCKERPFYRSVKVLTGSVRPISLPDPSPQLEKNIRDAKKIILYVQEAIPFSENFTRRIPPPPYRYDLESLAESEEMFRKEIVKNRKRSFLSSQPIEELLRIAEETGMGNCSEMSLLGCKYARMWEIAAEPAILFGGDHALIVIGRLKGSDPEDYRTWGPDAVLCDPWSGSYYPASKAPEYLGDFVDMITASDGKRYTQIEKFDPKRVTLSVCSEKIKPPPES
jgi:hypothetical protein